MDREEYVMDENEELKALKEELTSHWKTLTEAYSSKRLEKLYAKEKLSAEALQALKQTFQAAANLYGCAPLTKIYALFKTYHPGLITEKQFWAYTKIARHDYEEKYKHLRDPLFYILGEEELFEETNKVSTNRERYLVSPRLLWDDSLERNPLAATVAAGVTDLVILPHEDFLAYADPDHYEPCPEAEQVREMLLRPDMSSTMFEDLQEDPETIDEALACLRDHFTLDEAKIKSDAWFDDVTFENDTEAMCAKFRATLIAFWRKQRLPSYWGRFYEEVEPFAILPQPVLRWAKNDEARQLSKHAYAEIATACGIPESERQRIVTIGSVLVSLYGYCSLKQFWNTYRKQAQAPVSEDAFYALMDRLFGVTVGTFRVLGYEHFYAEPRPIPPRDRIVVHYSLFVGGGAYCFTELFDFIDSTFPKLPPYALTPEEFAEAAAVPFVSPHWWCEDNDALAKLNAAIDALKLPPAEREEFATILADDLRAYYDEIYSLDEIEACVRDNLLNYFDFEILGKEAIKAIAQAYDRVRRHQRLMQFRGHTRAEVDALCPGWDAKRED